MEGIAKAVSGGRVINRKLIKTKDATVKCWASRDYVEGKSKRNWYGLFEEELKDEDGTVLLFTTGNEQDFLVIPISNFLKEIKPYLRTTTEGYFFLVERDDKDWILPIEYIPKNLRAGIAGNGIKLSKYANNLSFLNSSYEKYLSYFVAAEINPVVPLDITSMIRTIAEKDPTFLVKSTEEKLIVIRYHQIKTQ